MRREIADLEEEVLFLEEELDGIIEKIIYLEEFKMLITQVKLLWTIFL